ncbi:MAG: AAA family ATPase [Firmicutes bacterium]|nr:AAA family ATPase [Bacillota bacterium]
MAKIIALTNQKGGVGKTTTCINLAACVAMEGKRVLLIDIDPQGNSSSGLGVEKNKLDGSLYNVLVGSKNIIDVIKRTQIENLDILPANIDLAGAEVELVYMEQRERVLSRVLEPVMHMYDFILIDCPPSLGLLTLNALVVAHSVLIPIQCEYFALEGLSQLMNTVKLLKKHLNQNLEVEGVVLTMYDSRSKLSQQVADEIKTFFGKKVYATVIPRNVRLSEAPSHGLPIILYDKSSSGAAAYKALADEFLSRNK